MKQLQINKLTFKYSNTTIFFDISLNFSPLWTGIVGVNGSGKTTLLKLISKDEKVQSGTISGNDLVYYCAQTLEKKPKGFDEFIYTYNTNTFRLKQLLKIEDEWFNRWNTLSFGERKRIQIAIALFHTPDILLLDEPTNHLDISSKNIVLKALKSFSGIGIIVSHDREVLNILCKNTVIIKDKKVYNYKSSFNTAIKELKEYEMYLQKQNKNINTQIKKLEKNITIQKQKVLESKERLSKKSITSKDKSLKEKINLAKLTGKDKYNSRLVNTFTKKLSETNSKKNYLSKEYDKGIVINEKSNNSKKFNLCLEEGKVKLSNEKILYYPNLSINHNDKIAIVGDNGVGKSTFLKYIISNLPEKHKYLYLPQEINKNQINKFFNELNSLNNEKKGRLFTLVQRLSSNPKNLLDTATSSPGEIKKLFIAKALLDDISLIILDEPTNHMDIDSIVTLERALKDYKNTLIFVSHDMQFIKNIFAKVWFIKEVEINKFVLE